MDDERRSQSSVSEGGGAAARVTALEAETRRLRDMLAAAGRLAELGGFAARQNHELRQPLFAIKGLAQLLLDQANIRPDEARDFARHVVEQAERMSALVEDLRRLALPPPAGTRPRADVSQVLLRVASLLDWRFRKGVTLRTEIGDDLPAVAVAAQALEQMLINLLSNALDAVTGRAAPIVQVRARLAGAAGGGAGGGKPTIEICVADNGSGVAKAARSRLFETFFTTKGAEVGTGLGLAVSREIARAAGGELDLLDDPGRWNEPVVTVFRLILPVTREP